jgi:hypothetical protein
MEVWWQGSRPLAITLLMPLDLGDGSDPSAARIARAKDALEVLGLEIGDVQDVPVEMPRVVSRCSSRPPPRKAQRRASVARTMCAGTSPLRVKSAGRSHSWCWPWATSRSSRRCKKARARSSVRVAWARGNAAAASGT